MCRIATRCLLSVVVLAAIAGQGCGDEPSSTETTQSNVIGGTTSTALPMIGGGALDQGTTGCTATLIASEWILTAGHCVYFYNYNGLNNPSHAFFYAGPTGSVPAGNPMYKATAVFNMSPPKFPLDLVNGDIPHYTNDYGPTAAGDSDIALAMLPHPVIDPTTNTVTSNAALATTYPAIGQSVTTWGGGPIVPNANPTGINFKSWNYSAPIALDESAGWVNDGSIINPGDSGGPATVNGSSTTLGAIWGVNSEYGESATGAAPFNLDRYGDVVYYRPQLCNLMYNKPHRFCRQGAPLGGEPSGCGPYVPGTTTNVTTYVLNERGFQKCGTAAWDGSCVAEAERVADGVDVSACLNPKGGIVGHGFSDIEVAANFTQNGFNYIPYAWSNGDGSFTGEMSYIDNPAFPSWMAGAKAISGDFDGDGFTDMALVGGLNWTTLPVALNKPTGAYYHVTNSSISGGTSIYCNGGSGFASWATCSGAQPITGDFDGDGKTDVALIGSPSFVGTGGGPSLGSYQGSIPLAFSNGDGTFRVMNVSDGAPGASGSGGGGYFQYWLTSLHGWRPVVGDFDGDGRSDIALVGGVDGAGQYAIEIPVVFSNGNDTFRFVLNSQSAGGTNFYADANRAALIVAGDFNNDGFADIAVTGIPGWTGIPVAFSNGDGQSFTATSMSDPGMATFNSLAMAPGVKAISGDFNGDGFSDIALTGGAGWTSIPVALNQGQGHWVAFEYNTNNSMGVNIPQLTASGSTPLGGAY